MKAFMAEWLAERGGWEGSKRGEGKEGEGGVVLL
jgi:hypothetical protein